MGHRTTAEPSEALIGRLIASRLRIDAHIGSGSMGHVYRARHLTLEKDVAIKVLKHFDGQSDSHARRFAREARAASRLDHPNSVAILDFGEDGEDRLLYIAMELVEGEDVQSILDRRGAFSLERTIEIMTQALSAVAAAHDQGVIHRDLKPSNLIVTQRPNDEGQLTDFVKVCDFGLAKFVSSNRESLDGSVASAARVAGTPAYMSPEQAVGDSLDVRTDLYSCGVILYEMLTGRLPFDADTAMGVMLKHVSEAAKPPSHLLEGLPRAVDAVVMWALEKPREHRCQSARQLRNAIRQLRMQLSGDLSVVTVVSEPDFDSGPVPFGASGPPPTPLTPWPPPSPAAGLPLPQPGDHLDLVADLAMDGPIPSAPLATALGATPSPPAVNTTPLPILELPTDPRAHSDGSVRYEMPRPYTPPPLDDGSLGARHRRDTPLPHLTAVPTPSLAAPKQPSEPDMEALVAEAVQSVAAEKAATSDLVEVPEHSLLAGLDSRRAGAAPSGQAMYVWSQYGISDEPYGGDHPFWVKDPRGKELGPMAMTDAMQVVRIAGAKGAGHTLEIAAEPGHWMPAATFVKLTGQEALLDREMHTRCADASQLKGDLESTSLPKLFMRVARERPTGRLLFRLRAHQTEVAYEIHIVGGRPTFVYANEDSLQIPRQLVAQELVQEHLLPKFVHMALVEERRLEDVVSREASMDLAPYRAVFMRERLGFLFRHPVGAFGLDTEVLPARTEPFTDSLIAALPDLVYRFMPEGLVRTQLAPRLNDPVTLSDSFRGAVRHLRPTRGQVETIRRLMAASTLQSAAPSDAKGERQYFAMAYVLTELGLIL